MHEHSSLFEKALLVPQVVPNIATEIRRGATKAKKMWGSVGWSSGLSGADKSTPRTSVGHV